MIEKAQVRRKLQGTVSPAERDAIRRLHERRNGLLELFKALPDLEKDVRGELYEKIVADLGDVTTKSQEWWSTKSREYGWEDRAGCRWEIDFTSCEVFLLDGGPAE
jgi:CXXX repeat modification system protein